MTSWYNHLISTLIVTPQECVGVCEAQRPHSRKEEISDWKDISALPETGFLRTRVGVQISRNSDDTEMTNSKGDHCRLPAFRPCLITGDTCTDFQILLHLLTLLTRKGVVLAWSSDYANAFATLKKKNILFRLQFFLPVV